MLMGWVCYDLHLRAEARGYHEQENACSYEGDKK